MDETGLLQHDGLGGKTGLVASCPNCRSSIIEHHEEIAAQRRVDAQLGPPPAVRNGFLIFLLLLVIASGGAAVLLAGVATAMFFAVLLAVKVAKAVLYKPYTLIVFLVGESRISKQTLSEVGTAIDGSVIAESDGRLMRISVTRHEFSPKDAVNMTVAELNEGMPCLTIQSVELADPA